PGAGAAGPVARKPGLSAGARRPYSRITSLLSNRIMQPHPVVVSGAGPVGLVAALSLAQKGVEVVVLESEDHIPQDLRAGTFHPPTVEMLDTLGIGETLRARAIRVPEWQVRDRKAGL